MDSRYDLKETTMNEAEQFVDNELGGNVSDSKEQSENSQTSQDDLDTELQKDTDQTDESQQSEEDEYVEKELNGKTYRIPKELEDAFLMRESYTQKTQELAQLKQTEEQSRAAFEQERALVAQSIQRQQANFQANVNLAALDGQLKQYEGIDFVKWSQENPSEAQTAYMQYNQMAQQRAELVNYIQQSENQMAQETQAQLQQRAQQVVQEVKTKIPNWNNELDVQLNQFAQQSGFKPEELGIANLDARHIEMLYYAKIGKEAIEKAKKQTQTPVLPTKTIKTNDSGAIKDPEKMTDAEWMVYRRKQALKK